MTFDEIEVRAMVRQICDEAGSLAAAGKEIGASKAYLSDILNGRRQPGPRILRHLGLRRVATVRYETVTREAAR